MLLLGFLELWLLGQAEWERGDPVGTSPFQLRQGGRLAVSDVIADEDMDEATRADVARWNPCEELDRG